MTGPLRSGPRAAAPAAAQGPAVDRGEAVEPLGSIDPQHRLGIALSGCIDPAIPSEDLLLDWLIGLPDGLDPAEAARRVIAAADPATTRNDRLLALLVDVAQWPLPRLARLGRARSIHGVRQRSPEENM